MKKVDARQSLPHMEEEVLRFWNEHSIFEKSVKNRVDANAPVYSFYDGPPFATGLPHYGHIVGQTLKDAVPRYWTMRGFQVERKWGWDCHGLPIENIAEKALGVNRKKDIEAMGVEKFNEFCRSKVLEYTEDWKKVTMRLGRWADRDNAYRTMDKEYMESVWWVFKQLWDKGLIYEHYRSMHVCTRCETTLSQSEVSEGYMDVKDLSVYAQFKINAGQKIGDVIVDDNTFVIAWTTTPWTLPGNVALAVGEDIEYVVVTLPDEERSDSFDVSIHPGTYIFSRDYFAGRNRSRVSTDKIDFITEAVCLRSGVSSVDIESESFDCSILSGVQVIKGSELLGLTYTPPFDTYFKNDTIENHSNGWKIYAADFVTTTDGTGVVHIAPAFGEDDMELGKRESLPLALHLGMDGIIKSEVTELAGDSVAPRAKDKPTEVREIDLKVRGILKERGLLFADEKYLHSYPHCWRCDTALINYATSSWFVKVADIKERALENAEHIHWSPEHVKAGRFGKWLEGARDWSISRQRFWASVIPVWKCEQCAALKVFGSAQELEDASGQKIDDLHKHIVDNIVISCITCNGSMKRIPDVLDTWFDSGSMPFAQHHYPFENTEKFENSFPAEFIAEGIDQTRAWFYYLHVLSTAITEKPAFKNVIVNGIVLAEDGKKMSKRLNNYPDPMLMFEKYGADAMRLYLLSSPVVSAENLNFSEKDMSEISRNVFRMLWNSYSFFVMYAEIDGWKPQTASDGVARATVSQNILDKWIISELHMLIREVNGYMEQYDIMRATRAFAPFVDNLSNWYIRQSRKRFWKSEDDTDKNAAYQTLYTVLVELSKLMAPFTPFIAEEIFRNLTDEESVHLTSYPMAQDAMIHEELNENMKAVREIITLGLQKRAEAKIRVRQPLEQISLGSSYEKLFNAILDPVKSTAFSLIIQDELNVKKIALNLLQGKTGSNEQVLLDTEITPALKREGEARELIRSIQESRKKAGFEVDDRIEVGYVGFEHVFADEQLHMLIQKETLAEKGLHEGEIQDANFSAEVKIDEQVLKLWLKK